MAVENCCRFVLSQYRFESFERQFCSDFSQKIVREGQRKD